MKISQPMMLLAGLYAFGLSGVLAAPSLGAIVTLCFYYYHEDTVWYRFSFRWPETLGLLRSGIPLALGSFFYWGFRTSDRSMVAAWLPMNQMGYFTFAMLFINQGCQWISDFTNILQVKLFGELGRLGKVRPISEHLQRLTLLILLVTGAAAGATQVAFHPAVHIFTHKFLPGVQAFEILALNLVCISAPILALTVLNSALLNRQVTSLCLQGGGLIVNVAVGWGLVRHGYGLPGIAWSSALSELALAAGAHAVLHPYLFEGAAIREMLRFYGWMLALLLGTFCIYFTMRCYPFQYIEGHNLLIPVISRGILVTFFWFSAATVTYSGWWKGGRLPNYFTESSNCCNKL